MAPHFGHIGGLAELSFGIDDSSAAQRKKRQRISDIFKPSKRIMGRQRDDDTYSCTDDELDGLNLKEEVNCDNDKHKKRIQKRQVDAKPTLVAGIDLGMTFSAVAFSVDSANPENVTHVRRFPGCTENRSKVRTVIAYASENVDNDIFEEGGDCDSRFGFEVPLTTKHHAFFKTSLDADATATIYDDPALLSEAATLLFDEPGVHIGRKAVTDSLRHLRDIAWGRATEEMGRDVLEKYHLKAVVTHPAAMSDEGRSNLHQAALQSGLKRRPEDEIVLRSEAECACVSVFIDNRKKYGSEAWREAFAKRRGVTVHDLGGLTADASTFRVTQNEPQLKIKQICPSQGGRCGTVAIYCRFHQHMAEIFGDRFTSLPRNTTGHGSRFLNDIEDELRKFDGSSLDKKRRFHLAMKDCDHHQYDDFDDSIIITGHEIKRILDENLRFSKLILENQINGAKKNGVKVKTLVLCGGGSLFPYIYQEIETFCASPSMGSIQMIRPEDPQSVVATGALISGLRVRVLGLRQSRACYGVKVHRKFVPGVGDAEDVFRCPCSGRKRLDGFMEWHIQMGDNIDFSKPGIGKTIAGYITIDLAALDDEREFACVIYSYLGDDPPDRVEAYGVRVLGSFVVKPSDMSKDAKQKLRRKLSGGTATEKLEMKIVQLINSESGLIEFQARVGRTVVGHYTLKYDATMQVGAQGSA